MAVTPSTGKDEISLHEVVHDHDLGDAKEEDLYLATLTPDEKIVEKQLRRKIDTLVMPMVVTVYLLNYIDRNNYAAAKLQGLEETLGLSATQYQLGLSILFVGYVSIAHQAHCGLG